MRISFILFIAIFTTILQAENFNNCSLMGEVNRTLGIKTMYSKMEIRDMPKIKLKVSSNVIYMNMDGIKSTEVFNYTEVKYNTRMYFSKNSMYLRRMLDNRNSFLWDLKLNNQQITKVIMCK